ncbi:transcriptional regulator with XRE-family HTH domain [Natronocella acetinitrilica]|uniref:Transcriptional regulator with XRE-family HTH domain n=1 Tax=Natronocella acetinitrilica TaxID=414046 RepID=A0AAE3G3Q1_9GAMM|nr:XRE family transcriptional regulator [Natronocella acetinitrilica]MCP1673347.1 transcriptional regulator with XRE-family HTH domain [Natronocella acetinitrilica]
MNMTSVSNGGSATALGSRIRELRGRRSRDRFASQLGIHKNTLARYENGERLPDAEMLHRLCSLCGVSADWLIHDRAVGPDAGSTWCLPEVDEVELDDAPMLLHRGWLKTQRVHPDRLMVRTMQGDGMAPTLGDGEVLFVLLQEDHENLAGDGIYLFEFDGQPIVKRLHGAGTRRAQLISDNPSYPAIDLPEDAIGQSCRIVGPVIWHLRRL